MKMEQVEEGGNRADIMEIKEKQGKIMIKKNWETGEH